MKSLTSFMLLLLCASCLYAQGIINKMEYWIDNDPGFGIATNVNISPAAEVTHSFAVPVASSLSVGLHTLGIRSRDNSGRWSHTNIFPAFVFAPLSNAPIDLIEYWIDRDTGIGIAVPVSGVPSLPDVNNFAFTIPTNLSVGFHTIGIRSRNSDGKWSHTNHFPVYVSDDAPGVLTKAEIHWGEETDPGFDAAHPTVFNAPLTQTFEGILSATTPPNFTIGTHLLFVRSKSTRGNWSHTNYISVMVDSIVSADDLQLQAGVKVFPNPFVDEITIAPSDVGKLRVVIYDQSGRLVGDVTVQGETTLDMSQLSSGTYSAFFWKGNTSIIYKMQLLKP